MPVEVPTESEFARTPDAVAGRALLEAGLSRIAPDARAAFDEAVRRCYGSAAGGPSQDGAPEADRGTAD